MPNANDDSETCFGTVHQVEPPVPYPLLHLVDYSRTGNACLSCYFAKTPDILVVENKQIPHIVLTI